jgi:hypothetical protein
MALHTDLAIHRTGSELLGLAFSIQEQMPRGMKRSLGEKIVQHCTEMLDLMALANASQHDVRAGYIQNLLTHQRALTVLLRVGHDKRWVHTKPWGQSVRLLGSIGAQAGGWLKKTNRAPAA